MWKISAHFVLLLLLYSCGGSSESTDSSKDNSAQLDLAAYVNTAPFVLSTDTRFYADIPYGDNARNVIDLFLPVSNTTTGLLVYIHGGGFDGGDKSSAYDPTDTFIIKQLLSKNIAFAAINYQLLQVNDQDGIIKSLNDIKRAIQFMKYHAQALNIKKERIVLLGGSAGAGASLWLGLNDDMADIDASEALLKESTRVHALALFSTQASYDTNKWVSDIFSEYQAMGFNSASVINILSEQYLFKFYGVDTLAELLSSDLDGYRQQLDLLNLMTADDPEFYLDNSAIDYVLPTNFDQLTHHPLHGLALYNKALSVGVAVKAVLTPLGINNTGGEDFFAFVDRKMAE